MTTCSYCGRHEGHAPWCANQPLTAAGTPLPAPGGEKHPNGEVRTCMKCGKRWWNDGRQFCECGGEAACGVTDPPPLPPAAIDELQRLCDRLQHHGGDVTEIDVAKLAALLARIRELEQDLRLWKPMTPEQAEKELAAVEAEPASEEEINAMLKRILDPAERLNNREETQIRQKILSYRLLLKLKDDELRTARQSIQRLRSALTQSTHAKADADGSGYTSWWTDAEIDAVERGGE